MSDDTKFKPGNKAAEKWTELECYDKYEVSSLGRFRFNRKNGTVRYMKPSLGSSGYLQLGITIKGFTKKKGAHRWVMESFMPNPNMKKLEVNHKDGNKLNNNIENLEWCTPKENQAHRRNILGKTNNGCNKMVLDLKTGIYYDSAKEAYVSRLLNVKYSHFTSILKGTYKNKTDFIYV